MNTVVRTITPEDVPPAPPEVFTIRCTTSWCAFSKPLVKYAAHESANAAAEWHVAKTRHTVVIEEEREEAPS